MNKINKHLSFFLTLLFLLFTSLTFAEEQITITTYYPSPYGSYNSLQTDKLGVGDNSGDDILNSADVPTTTGDAWIKGKLGIGTGTAGPGVKLDVRSAGNSDDVAEFWGGTNTVSIETGKNANAQNAIISLANNKSASKDFLIAGFSLGNIGNFTVNANTTFFNGNAGIGIADPSPYKLAVVGASTDSGLFIQASGTSGFPLSIKNSSGADLTYMRSTGDLIVATGNVGIGTAGPDTKLHVIGAVCAEATDSGCAPTSGDVRGTRLCIGSDCRSSWQSTLSQTNCYQIIVPHAGAAMCNVGDYAAGVAASNWNEDAGGHENWVVCCTP